MPKTAKQHITLVGQAAINFGAFLKVLRTRHGLRQIDVLTHLPDWTQTNYSRVESDELAPAFDQLPAIYTALRHVGVKLTALDRHQFVLRARARIETKRSHQERKSQREWDELSLRLGRGDEETASLRSPSRPRLVETRHLVGREEWLTSLLTQVQGVPAKKLLVLQGPVGIGKSSELHRLGSALLTLDERRPQVALCALPPVEGDLKPEEALDLVLATLFAEVGPPGASLPLTTLEVRMALTLDFLQEVVRPLVLLVDDADHLLDGGGELALCWKQFLMSFLRSKHCASLVLATKVWPGWFEQELPKHDMKWWVTGGRIEQGEKLFDGAKREVLEQTGIPIELEGFIEIQHNIANGVLLERFWNASF